MAFYDRAWMSVASTGTGTITLGSAVTAFRSFAAAGVADQATVSYTIIDGTNWETGRGTYTASGTTLSRTPIATSAGNTSPIALTANASVFLDMLAVDLAGFASLVTTAAQTFAGAITVPSIVATSATVNTAGGSVLIGPAAGSTSYRAFSLSGVLASGQIAGFIYSNNDTTFYLDAPASTAIAFRPAGTEAARIDTNGNLLVGVGSGSTHYFAKGSTEGTNIVQFGFPGTPGVAIYQSSGSGYGNAANCTMRIGYNSTTSRSINAGGTINASGADYAEYMPKAAGCGTIAKGDVCGVDAGGFLVTTWNDAISFKVKSTDPNLVGGDSWAAHLGTRPVEPVLALPRYDGPPEAMPTDVAEYEAAQASYATAVSDAQATHDAAHDQWKTDLAKFETALEAARQTVDRIAYCGQVPVNFAGSCQPGDYLVAVQNGDGIGLAAVAPADMTLPQYMARVGRILAIRDGRPWVDVQHG